MKKRIVILTLFFSFMLSLLVSCGSNSKSGDNTNTTIPTSVGTTTEINFKKNYDIEFENLKNYILNNSNSSNDGSIYTTIYSDSLYSDLSYSIKLGYKESTNTINVFFGANLDSNSDNNGFSCLISFPNKQPNSFQGTYYKEKGTYCPGLVFFSLNKDYSNSNHDYTITSVTSGNESDITPVINRCIQNILYGLDSISIKLKNLGFINCNSGDFYLSYGNLPTYQPKSTNTTPVDIEEERRKQAYNYLASEILTIGTYDSSYKGYVYTFKTESNGEHKLIYQSEKDRIILLFNYDATQTTTNFIYFYENNKKITGYCAFVGSSSFATINYEIPSNFSKNSAVTMTNCSSTNSSVMTSMIEIASADTKISLNAFSEFLTLESNYSLYYFGLNNYSN